MSEYLFLVDENDHPLDIQCERSVVHEEMKYFHRTTALCLLDKQGNILCNQRSYEKDTHPGLWTFNFGGHVGFGEIAVENAARELEEELGLRVSQEDFIFIGKHSSHDSLHINYVYALLYDPTMGDFVFLDGEVLQTKWKPFVNVIDEAKSSQWCSPVYPVIESWVQSHN